MGHSLGSGICDRVVDHLIGDLGKLVREGMDEDYQVDQFCLAWDIWFAEKVKNEEEEVEEEIEKVQSGHLDWDDTWWDRQW